jgi:hypothetical protein
MRPKRYLRDEYKQLGHVCHPNRQVLGEIFRGWVRFDRPIVTWSCPLPEAPAYHHSPGVGGVRHSTVSCHSGCCPSPQVLGTTFGGCWSSPSIPHPMACRSAPGPQALAPPVRRSAALLSGAATWSPTNRSQGRGAAWITCGVSSSLSSANSTRVPGST